MKKTVKNKLGITKAQAKAWKRGMETANALDLEEAKHKTPEERFWALIRLMHFALSLKKQRRRPSSRDYETAEVAARWARLRKADASRQPSA